MKAMCYLAQYPIEDRHSVWDGMFVKEELVLALMIYVTRRTPVVLTPDNADYTDKNHMVWEFEEPWGRFLAAVYRGHEYAAIWQRKE